MNANRSKQLTGIACSKWYRRKKVGDPVSERRTKLYSKLCNCGKSFRFRGESRKYYCKTMVCATCCERYFSRNTKKFVSQYPNACNGEFKAVTIGLGYTYSLEEAFSMFRDFRTKVSRSISNKRVKSSARMNPWKEVSMLGSFEISSFKPVDFYRLGSDLQRQFVEEYEYDQDRLLEDLVYHPHFHAVIYTGGLDNGDVYNMFASNSKHVHINELHFNKSVLQNVNKYLEYGSKVRYANKFGDGRIEEWDIERIRSYCDVVSMQKGQQGRKMFIKKMKLKDCSKVV